MLRDEAGMKARIEEEYRAKAEAEARDKIETEMKAQEEAAARTRSSGGFNSKGGGTSNGAASHGGAGGGGGGGSSTRGLRLTSPGGSSDGTEVNSLSARSSEGGKDNGIGQEDGPPFSGGRMLDLSEAEEMNAAIKQLYLKTPSGGTPFVLFKARLRTSRREWNIERRYSDFVWLHEVWSGMVWRLWGGGGRAYSFVACFSRLTIDYASLSRRGTVPISKGDTSNTLVLSAFFQYIT